MEINLNDFSSKSRLKRFEKRLNYVLSYPTVDSPKGKKASRKFLNTLLKLDSTMSELDRYKYKVQDKLHEFESKNGKINYDLIGSPTAHAALLSRRINRDFSNSELIKAIDIIKSEVL